MRERSAVRAHSWFSAMGVVAMALLPGCPGSQIVPVESNDAPVFFPSARVTWFPEEFEGADQRASPLFGGRAAAATTATPTAAPPRTAAVRGSLGIELDAAATHGSDTQQLENLQTVQLDGPFISGPARLDTKFDLSSATLAARGGLWIKNRLGLEAMVGVGAIRLDFDLDSGNVHDSLTDQRYGPYIGGQVTYVLVDSWTAYLRIAATHALDSGLTTVAYLDMIELGTEAHVVDHVGLFAGWRWWTYENNHYPSNIDINASGPMVGLHVFF
jgi:hypothetical protein